MPHLQVPRVPARRAGRRAVLMPLAEPGLAVGRTHCTACVPGTGV